MRITGKDRTEGSERRGRLQRESKAGNILSEISSQVPELINQTKVLFSSSSALNAVFARSGGEGIDFLGVELVYVELIQALGAMNLPSLVDATSSLLHEMLEQRKKLNAQACTAMAKAAILLAQNPVSWEEEEEEEEEAEGEETV